MQRTMWLARQHSWTLPKPNQPWIWTEKPPREISSLGLLFLQYFFPFHILRRRNLVKMKLQDGSLKRTERLQKQLKGNLWPICLSGQFHVSKWFLGTGSTSILFPGQILSTEFTNQAVLCTYHFKLCFHWCRQPQVSFKILNFRYIYFLNWTFSGQAS